MTGQGDTEAYVHAVLDSLDEAIRQRDVPAVMQRLDHVRREAGELTANILTQVLIERGLALPPAPTQPVPTIPAPAIPPPPLHPSAPPEPPAKWSRTAMAVAALVVAVAVTVTAVVTVQLTRAAGEATVTVTAPQPSPGTTSPSTPVTAPVPVTTTAVAPTAANSTTAIPPAPAWTMLHPLTDFEMAGKSCSDSDQGTLDIDELAPDYRKATLEYTDCGDAISGLGMSYEGKYMAKAGATQPEPQDCESQAKRSSQRKYPVEDMKPGQFALCVVSTKGNVAWILVSSKASGTLGLKIIVWSRG